MLIPAQKGMRLRRMSAKRMATMFHLLMKEDGYTMPELAQLTDLPENVVWDYINELRAKRAPKILYVADWRSTRAGIRPVWTPAYALGSEPDMPRPPKKSARERCQEYRARKEREQLDATLNVALNAARGE